MVHNLCTKNAVLVCIVPFCLTIVLHFQNRGLWPLGSHEEGMCHCKMHFCSIDVFRRPIGHNKVLSSTARYLGKFVLITDFFSWGLLYHREWIFSLGPPFSESLKIVTAIVALYKFRL